MADITKKRFPQEYLDLPESSNLEYLFGSREGDLKGFRLTIIRLATELGVWQNLQLGGTITPVSTPPAEGDYFWIATEEGTYTNYGGVEVPAGSLAVISRVDGVFTSSITAITQAVDEVTEDGTLPVSQRGVYNFTVRKKEHPMFNYAVMDKEGNLIFYYDKNNILHAEGISKESLPPPDLRFEESDKVDFGIRGVNGEYAIWVEDGQVFPNKGNGGAVSIASGLNFTDTLEYISQHVGKDMIWNQWIYPVAVTDSQENIWFSGVGYRGALYICKVGADGTFIRKRIGNILSNLGSFQSDDHNAPAILLDERPNADYPIMIFQVDHNTTPMRVWKFSSLNPSDWDVDSYENIGTANLAYSQPHRNGDEIFLFARRPPLPRPWRILYSSNNGDSWAQKDIFYPSADWLYMLTIDKEDGSGVHIMSYGHPTNSQNQNIYYLSLDYATGQITNPSTGVVVADIRDAMTNPAFVPIDPFSVGLEIYTAVGEEINRMWDYKEDESGNLSLLLTSQTVPSFNKTGYETSRYKVVNFNLTTGAINHVTELGKAGYGIEQSSYWAGGTLLSGTKALLCQWTPKSITDGGNNIYDEYGKTDIYSVDFADTNDLVVEQVRSTPLKAIRPATTPDGKYVLMPECKHFTTYDNFYANTVVIEIETLNI